MRVTPPPHVPAAALLGITPAQYLAHQRAGEKWCTDCQAWHPRDDFGRDRSQRDGLDRRCKIARKVRDRRRAARQRAAKAALVDGTA